MSHRHFIINSIFLKYVFVVHLKVCLVVHCIYDIRHYANT